jgi:hypothetical protein
MSFSWNVRVAHLLLALATLVSVSCGPDPDDPLALARAHILLNGDFPQDDVLPVRYQPLADPLLEQLASREHLRDVVAGAPRQLDQIQRLRDWVNAQWPDGNPSPYPPWNALTVLDWIRAGKTGGFCGQYAQVFLQSLAALGFTARYVEIGSRDNPYAHYVTEVWSNEFDKWVVMDPDFNGYFERDGVPLSALEIHDAFVSPALTDVVPVFAEARPGHATPTTWPHGTAELYYYLRYHLNANQLSKPDENPFDRFDDMIAFADPRVPSWEVSTVASIYPKEQLTRRSVGDARLVSAKLNQVQLILRSATATRLTIDLRDNVLQRASYQYRLIPTAATAGAWQSVLQPTLVVPMPDHGALVEVRGVNIRGVAGPSALLAIDPLRPTHALR